MHSTSTQGHHAPAMCKLSSRGAHLEKLECSPSGNIRTLIHGQRELHPACLCSDPHPLSSLPLSYPEAAGRRDRTEFYSLHEAAQKILSKSRLWIPFTVSSSCLEKCKKYRLCPQVIGQIIHWPLEHPGLEWTRPTIPETQLVTEDPLRTVSPRGSWQNCL